MHVKVEYTGVHLHKYKQVSHPFSADLNISYYIYTSKRARVV